MRATIVSLRDDVVFPEERIVLAIGRQRSLAALARGIPMRSARRSIDAITEAGRFADVVIGAARLPLEERRELFEETRPAARVGRVLTDVRKWTFRVAQPDSWFPRARRWLLRGA